MLQIASAEDLRLILWEREGIKLKEVLERSKEKRRIFFIIGPEGGFNQLEVDEAKRAGFTPVTLGRRILRAETASLCFLSILQYERGDIG
jgi:16S rRNA (uracil1498-N3)-methyltransferase